MAALNVIIDEGLKARLDTEKDEQKRTLRALIEIALERYFADLDREREYRQPS